MMNSQKTYKNNLMIRFLFIIGLFISTDLSAQFSFSIDQSINVNGPDGQTPEMPWAGGLNAAQYNTLDLDNDGNDDLVLFDRMANKVITFLNINNQYAYAPQYESFFPADVRNWMLLRDYNCDGKKDIFTSDLLGIKVFMNTSEGGSPPTWERILFYTGTNGPKSDVILTKGFSGLINLQLQYDDLPALIDADGDGDLDIFNVRFIGDGTIEYHQNFSKELYNSCDSLVFERITQRWGGVQECGCAEFAFNNEECNHSGGRIKHAGGKSLLAFDANGDQLMDIVFSEAECNQLYLFVNEGTEENATINSFQTFPINSPVDFTIFPAAFYEDVDFDGVKDLISSPNIFAKENVLTNLEQSNWLYKNTGTTSNPSFELIQQDFLQSEMIDVGDNSVPAFADEDGDGDLDLFISRNASTSGTSTIFFFRNTGSSTDPQFTFESTDYLDFSNKGFYNLKIRFADIDDNDTRDLVFTGTDDTGFTRLYYVKNNSAGNLRFDDNGVQPIQFTLTFRENLSVIDIDADGFADILAGRNNGKLEYWKNSGNTNSISFTLEDNAFLDIGSSVFEYNIAASTADLDADGRDDLIIGDESGKLKIITDYKGERLRVSEFVRNTITNTNTEYDFGSFTWPVATDLYGSGKPSIFVGTIMGGIYALKNESNFFVYPNPVTRPGTMSLQVDEDMNLDIYTSTGSRVNNEPISIVKDAPISFHLRSLAAGFYIFRFSGKNKSYTRKIIVR